MHSHFFKILCEAQSCFFSNFEVDFVFIHSVIPLIAAIQCLFGLRRLCELLLSNGALYCWRGGIKIIFVLFLHAFNFFQKLLNWNEISISNIMMNKNFKLICIAFFHLFSFNCIWLLFLYLILAQELQLYIKILRYFQAKLEYLGRAEFLQAVFPKFLRFSRQNFHII